MSARKLVARPLTPARWRDLVALFGENGACGGCWCMFFHKTGREYKAARGAKNRRALQRRVRAGVVPGLIGYVAGVPAAWIAVEPRSSYQRLMRSRKLRPAEREPVWSLPCFFVHRDFRGQGLNLPMLRAAMEYARRRGAKLLEGYPVDLRARTAAAFAYHGVASTFVQAGFAEVARNAPTRPLMRCEL